MSPDARSGNRHRIPQISSPVFTPHKQWKVHLKYIRRGLCNTGFEFLIHFHSRWHRKYRLLSGMFTCDTKEHLEKTSTFNAKISKDINVYVRCIITHLSKLCFEAWICHRGLQILQILTGPNFSPGTVSVCSLSTAI